MKNLNESSLSRVWQHVKSAKPICILTAFCGEHELQKNIQRNKALAADIRAAGYGYFFVDGYWI